MEKLCVEEGLGVEFEYTVVNTPQQNGKVERKFAMFYGRVRAMMTAARITPKMRRGLWCECASTATDHDNMIVGPYRSVPPHNAFYEKDAKYARM